MESGRPNQVSLKSQEEGVESITGFDAIADEPVADGKGIKQEIYELDDDTPDMREALALRLESMVAESQDNSRSHLTSVTPGFPCIDTTTPSTIRKKFTSVLHTTTPTGFEWDDASDTNLRIGSRSEAPTRKVQSQALGKRMKPTSSLMTIVDLDSDIDRSKKKAKITRVKKSIADAIVEMKGKQGNMERPAEMKQRDICHQEVMRTQKEVNLRLLLQLKKMNSDSDNERSKKKAKAAGVQVRSTADATVEGQVMKGKERKMDPQAEVKQRDIRHQEIMRKQKEVNLRLLLQLKKMNSNNDIERSKKKAKAAGVQVRSTADATVEGQMMKGKERKIDPQAEMKQRDIRHQEIMRKQKEVNLRLLLQFKGISKRTRTEEDADYHYYYEEII